MISLHVRRKHFSYEYTRVVRFFCISLFIIITFGRCFKIPTLRPWNFCLLCIACLIDYYSVIENPRCGFCMHARFAASIAKLEIGPADMDGCQALFKGASFRGLRSLGGAEIITRIVLAGKRLSKVVKGCQGLFRYTKEKGKTWVRDVKKQMSVDANTQSKRCLIFHFPQHTSNSNNRFLGSLSWGALRSPSGVSQDLRIWCFGITYLHKLQQQSLI